MFAIYHLVPSEYKGTAKYVSIQEPHNAFHSYLQAQIALDEYTYDLNSDIYHIGLGIKEIPFSDFFKDVSKNIAFGWLLSNCIYEWKEYWEPYSDILERRLFYKIFDTD